MGVQKIGQPMKRRCKPAWSGQAIRHTAIGRVGVEARLTQARSRIGVEPALFPRTQWRRLRRRRTAKPTTADPQIHAAELLRGAAGSSEQWHESLSRPGAQRWFASSHAFDGQGAVPATHERDASSQRSAPSQKSPLLQSRGWPWQTLSKQLSLTVQKEWSSHWVPFGLGLGQRPVFKLQVPASWQPSGVEQSLGVPSQTLPLHWSPVVHRL